MHANVDESEHQIDILQLLHGICLRKHIKTAAIQACMICSQSLLNHNISSHRLTSMNE